MSGEIVGKLKSILTHVAPEDATPEQIAGLTNIDELNLDSLQILEFLLKVEEEFKIEIDDDNLDIELIGDLSKLARYLEENHNVGTA